jgi:hypothetical protein
MKSLQIAFFILILGAISNVYGSHCGSDHSADKIDAAKALHAKAHKADEDHEDNEGHDKEEGDSDHEAKEGHDH